MIANYQASQDGSEWVAGANGQLFIAFYNMAAASTGAPNVTLYDGDVVKINYSPDSVSGAGYYPTVLAPATDSGGLTLIGVVQSGGFGGDSDGKIPVATWGWLQVRGLCQKVNLSGTTVAIGTSVKAGNGVYNAAYDQAVNTLAATSFGVMQETITQQSVTGASNASPIVITSAAHGLSTGDTVTLVSVGTNTAANARYKVTVVSSSTFSLDGSTGNGTYSTGGTFTKQAKVWLLGTRVTV